MAELETLRATNLDGGPPGDHVSRIIVWHTAERAKSGGTAYVAHLPHGAPVAIVSVCRDLDPWMYQVRTTQGAPRHVEGWVSRWFIPDDAQ